MSKRTQFHSGRKGTVLVVAIVLLIMLSAASAAFLGITQASNRSAKQRYNQTKSFFLAESAAQWGQARLLGQLQDGIIPPTVWSESRDLRFNMSIMPDGTLQINAPSGQGEITHIDNTPDDTDGIRGDFYRISYKISQVLDADGHPMEWTNSEGETIRQYLVSGEARIVSVDEADTESERRVTSRVLKAVTVRETPLIQDPTESSESSTVTYLFWNGDLELLPGPQMSCSGRIHTNSNLYLGAGNKLTLDTERVSATGHVLNCRKNSWSFENWLKNPLTLDMPDYEDLMDAGLGELAAEDKSTYLGGGVFSNGKVYARVAKRKLINEQGEIEEYYAPEDYEGDTFVQDGIIYRCVGPRTSPMPDEDIAAFNGTITTGTLESQYEHFPSRDSLEPFFMAADPNGSYAFNTQTSLYEEYNPSNEGSYEKTASGEVIRYERQQGKYYSEADLLLVDNSFYRWQTHEDGSKELVPVDLGDDIVQEKTFWDGRERKDITVTDVDMEKLCAAINEYNAARVDGDGVPLDPNDPPIMPSKEVDGTTIPYGAFYATRTDCAPWQPNGIRLSNARVLDRNMVITTNDPLYVKGTFNAPSDSEIADGAEKQAVFIIADSFNVLSDKWNDSKGHSGLPTARGWDPDSGQYVYEMTINAGIIAGNTETLAPNAPVPSRSIEFYDAESGTTMRYAMTPEEYASEYLSSSVYRDLNGRLVIKPDLKSSAWVYSGGFENYPRFHEKWSGVTLKLRGAFGCFWESRCAMGRWRYGGNVYTAPKRDWNYDDTVEWSRLTPGDEGGNSLGSTYTVFREVWIDRSAGATQFREGR